MPSKPNAQLSRLLLWAGLVVSVGLIAVGLNRHWNVALPVAGLFRLLFWMSKGVYCIAPILALGWIVVRWTDQKTAKLGPVQVVAMSWAAGWTLITLTGIVMLATGLYDPLVWQLLAAAVWLGVLVWSVATRWQWVTTTLEAARALPRNPLKLLTWESLLVLIAVATTLHASLPPDTRDELSYHLVAPMLWAHQGNWWVPIDNFHLLFPGNTELIWGWATAVAGLGAARFVTLAFAMLTVALLVRWMIESGAARWIRLLSLVFLLVTPVVVTTAAICYVEWPLMFFIFNGWLASRRAAEEDGDGTPIILWTAVLWAMALGMKYTAAIVVIPLAGEWVWALRSRRPRRAVAAMGAMAGGIALLVLPWFARNWLATGDPIYPLGAILGFSGAVAHDTGTLSHYSDLAGWWRWMPWLYHATVETIGDHRLHPLWPMLHALVIAFGWRWRKELPWFTVVVSSATLVWFTPAPRIYLPLMLIVWLFLPKYLATLPGTKIDRRVASVTMGLMAVVSLPIALHFMFAPGGRAVPDHLLGATGKSTYLRQRGLVGPATLWVSQNTDPDAKIWAWCEDRVLYLDRWTRSDSPYGPPGFLRLVEAGGESAIDDALRADGIDFVLLRRDRCPDSWTHAALEKHRWEIDASDQADLHEWATVRLEELVRDDRHTLYRVRR